MNIRKQLGAAIEPYDRNGDAYMLEIITKGGARLRGAPYQFAPEDGWLRLDVAVADRELEATHCEVAFAEIAAFIVIPI